MHRLLRRPQLRLNLPQSNQRAKPGEPHSVRKPPLPHRSEQTHHEVPLPHDALSLLRVLESGHIHLTDAGCAALLLHLRLHAAHDFLLLSFVFGHLREHHGFHLAALAAATLLFLRLLDAFQRAFPAHTHFAPSGSGALIWTNAQVVAYRKARGATGEFAYIPLSLVGPAWKTAGGQLSPLRELAETATATVADGVDSLETIPADAAVLVLSASCLHFERALLRAHESTISTETVQKCVQTLLQNDSDIHSAPSPQIRQLLPLAVKFGPVDLVESLTERLHGLDMPDALRCDLLRALCGNVYWGSTVVTKTATAVFTRFHACCVAFLRHFPKSANSQQNISAILNRSGGDDFLKKYVRNYRSGLLREVYDALPQLHKRADAFPRAFFVGLLQGPCRDLRHRCISALPEIAEADFTSCWQQTAANALILLRRDLGVLKIALAQGQEVLATARQFLQRGMHAEMRAFKRFLWREFAMELMRGHRRHVYNVLTNLCNSAAFLLEALLALLRFCSVELSRDFARAFRARHPQRFPLTPRLTRLLSHPEYRLLAPQRFWWRCNCRATETTRSPETPENGALSFLRADDPQKGPERPPAAFQHILAAIDSPGSLSANPGSSVACEHCGGYTCACGRTFPSAVSVDACPTCAAPTAWHTAAAQTQTWYCAVCATPVRGKICGKCRTHDAKQFWACAACRHQNPNDAPGPHYCLQCGDLRPAEGAARATLLACRFCPNLHFFENRGEGGKGKWQGVYCEKFAKKVLSQKSANLWILQNYRKIPYFTWRCGCGAQNPPFQRHCRRCGVSRFLCAWCHTAQTLRRLSQRSTSPADEFSLVTRDHCRGCRMPHPRTSALFAAKRWECPACARANSILDVPRQCTHGLSALSNGEIGCLDAAEWNATFRAENSHVAKAFEKLTPKYIFPFAMRKAVFEKRQLEKRDHPFTCTFWLCASCWVANPRWAATCALCDESEGAARVLYPPWRAARGRKALENSPPPCWEGLTEVAAVRMDASVLAAAMAA